MRRDGSRIFLPSPLCRYKVTLKHAFLCSVIYVSGWHSNSQQALCLLCICSVPCATAGSRVLWFCPFLCFFLLFMFFIVLFLIFQVPVLKPTDLMVEVRPRRVFSNGHTYHVNSISVNSDGETYLSADDLRINMWHLGITDRSFSILCNHDLLCLSRTVFSFNLTITNASSCYSSLFSSPLIFSCVTQSLNAGCSSGVKEYEITQTPQK